MKLLMIRKGQHTNTITFSPFIRMLFSMKLFSSLQCRGEGHLSARAADSPAVAEAIFMPVLSCRLWAEKMV
jgi:hypothetical protein